MQSKTGKTTFDRPTQPTVAEVAVIIFFLPKGIKRRSDKITAVYVDGSLLEYGSQHTGDIEGYVDGFLEGISYGRRDGSIHFVRGTAKLLANQEPPISLSNVVRRGIEWESGPIVEEPDDEDE